MDTDLEDENTSFSMSQEIAMASEASLLPLKEDLAEWLSRILDVKITGENFMDSLSNGVLPCKLAVKIQKKAEEYHKSGLVTQEFPKFNIKYRENAAKESFFARDNTANFLAWCRGIGLPETCLFDSEGLVLKKQQKDVLVCIYELARVASQFNIEPPGLIKLEKEIEQEEKKSVRPSTAPVKTTPTAKAKPAKPSKLDREIRRATSHYECDITRLAEGKYNINGKIVLIRLLKEKHLMVRVGGGWDTLEHFLIKHDPTNTVHFSRGSNKNDEFLVIHGKYKTGTDAKDSPSPDSDSGTPPIGINRSLGRIQSKSSPNIKGLARDQGSTPTPPRSGSGRPSSAAVRRGSMGSVTPKRAAQRRSSSTDNLQSENAATPVPASRVPKERQGGGGLVAYKALASIKSSPITRLRPRTAPVISPNAK